MNKVVVRLLLFVIALPALLLVAMWDWGNHLALSVLAVVISALGAGETAGLLRSKGLSLHPYLPYAAGTLFPAFAYLENAGWIASDLTLVLVALFMVAILIRQIFANTEENLVPVLGQVVGIVFTLVYPGFFLYFIVRMASLPESWILLPVFLLATIGNDAWAWMFGTLFGRRSPKPFLVSPSKSLVGFGGGILATFLVLFAAFWLFPGLLGRRWDVLAGVALLVSLLTIAGDLFESSLKRSARVKDSGDVIPGRGGILDSVDSLLFAAPVFYLFLQYGRG